MRCILLFLPLLLLAAETPARKTAPAKNFKEFGSSAAPITVEVYTDYQCPHCRTFYMEVMPEFMKNYVLPGKVRLLHRDFPLSMHPFAVVAVRYANAAGQIGRYELASDQIFRTQSEWSQNGNVDAQLAKVLPPGEMQKVRDIVKNDQHLDDTVKADVAMGTKDGVSETPTLEIVVRNGNRQQIGGFVEYSLLKRYIDQLLAAK